MQAVAFLGMRSLTFWLVAFQGCSYHPWPAAENKPRLVSKLLQTSSCPCCWGRSQSGKGLAASTLFALEWAESVQSGCRSEGTCPPWLWLALLSYAGPGLEPGVSRPAQLTLHTSMSRAGQATRMVWRHLFEAVASGLSSRCFSSVLSHYWRHKRSGNVPRILLTLMRELSEEGKGEKKLLEEGGLWQLRESGVL